MIAGSRTNPCAELREEIRHLEDELRVLDAQLKQASARVEIPSGDSMPPSGASKRIDPSPDLFSSPPRIDREPHEREAVAAQLRRGVGAACAPYRKVAFSDEGRKAKTRWSSRLARWAGMAVVLGGIAGIWALATRIGPPGNDGRQKASSSTVEPVADAREREFNARD